MLDDAIASSYRYRVTDISASFPYRSLRFSLSVAECYYRNSRQLY